MFAPISKRGYKDGLMLFYIDPKHLGISVGECHLVSMNDFNDKIVQLQSNYTIEITYIQPWHYHFVYIAETLNNMILRIVYSDKSPTFDLNRGGFYNEDSDERCIGSFFVADGIILEFEQLTNFDHNYEIPNSIYRFTRTNLRNKLPFSLWRSDRLPSKSLQNYHIDNNWTTYYFKYPNWGNSLDTCNIEQMILIFIAIVDYSYQELYIRKPKTIHELENDLSNLEKEAIICLGKNLEIQPNNIYPYTIFPEFIETPASIDDFGGIEFQEIEKTKNIIHDLSTIGYVLPLFIDNYIGFFPKKYKNIYEGFELAKLDNHKILVNKGIIYFKTIENIGILKDSIIIDCSDHLYPLLWFYVYVENPKDSSDLNINSFIISLDYPINENNYHPHNKLQKCIGTFKTNKNNHIDKIYYNLEKYPPNECEIDPVGQVKKILESVLRENPLFFNKLLNHINMDCSWEKYPSHYLELDENYVVYRCLIDPIKKTKVKLEETYLLSKIRFKEESPFLIPLIDEWDVCDNYIWNYYKYLITKNRTSLPPEVIGSCFESSYEISVLNKFDEIDLYSMDKNIENYMDLIKPDPINYYNIEELFDLRQNPKNLINVLSIVYHDNQTIIDNIKNEEKSTFFKIEKINKIKEQFIYPLENIKDPNMYSCLDENNNIIGTSYIPVSNMSEEHIRVYDNECNSLNNLQLIPNISNISISILFDFDSLKEQYLKSIQISDFIYQFTNNNIKFQLTNMVSDNIDSTSFYTSFETGTNHLYNNLRENLRKEKISSESIDYLEYIKISINDLIIEESDINYILLIGNNYNQNNIWDDYIISFFECIDLIINNNIMLYIISDDIYEDLYFLTKLNSGKYYNLSSYNLFNDLILFKNDVDNNKKYYKLTYNPKLLDPGDHDIVIKLAGQFKNEFKSKYTIKNKKDFCNLKNLRRDDEL